MEVGAEDQLTRRERLRAEREVAHAAPARIRLRLAGVVVIVIGLLSWLVVSWLSGAAPAGAPVPEPPPLHGSAPAETGQGEAEWQGTEQSGDSHAETSGQGGASGVPQGSGPSGPPGGADGSTGGSGGLPGAGGGPPGAEQSSPVVVHVGGAVAKPGVVELVSGARVHEAIEAAGGMTSKADPGGLNLAAPVQDGTLIWVPTPEELEAGAGPPAGGQDPIGGNASATPGAAPGTGTGNGTGAAPGTGAGDLINLNTADAATLDELPGIGPALSERIISHRESSGPFSSLEELAGVSGIGPVILADVEGLVTW